MSFKKSIRSKKKKLHKYSSLFHFSFSNYGLPEQSTNRLLYHKVKKLRGKMKDRYMFHTDTHNFNQQHNTEREKKQLTRIVSFWTLLELHISRRRIELQICVRLCWLLTAQMQISSFTGSQKIV